MTLGHCRQATGKRGTPRVTKDTDTTWLELYRDTANSMPQRWNETVREAFGSGILRDPQGNHCEVAYRFTIQQVRWERPALNAPTTIGRGTHSAHGLLTFHGSLGSIDINSNLKLELETGGSVTVVLTGFIDPSRPATIAVSDFDHLLTPE